METINLNFADIGLQRFWSRSNHHTVHDDDLIAGDLCASSLFPPEQVEQVFEDEQLAKSRPSSPLCQPCSQQGAAQPSYSGWQEDDFKCEIHSSKQEIQQNVELDGGNLNDIPAKYTIPKISTHEFPAIGVYIDPRIVSGFKYKVRPIQQKIHWLFNGRALKLESIGRGYSRRITFCPDPGHLNDNSHYFWSDSRSDGFAFEIQVIDVGDKFTVFDAEHIPIGTLEVIQKQGAQEEIVSRITKTGSVEKSIKVRALCEVEWFYEDDTDHVVPMTGLAICAKTKNNLETRLVNVKIGNLHTRRGLSLTPGKQTNLRSIVVQGSSINDVPATYRITGLDSYELPVIGTYIDKRILPGFHYRVRPAGNPLGHKRGKPLFKGRALQLISIGAGYGKRITFIPDELNQPNNYFWSDSYPDGLGFEPSAVRSEMIFEIYTGNLKLGQAHVFRDELPQNELYQEIVKQQSGDVLLMKYIHIDVKCHVTLEVGAPEWLEPHVVRVSGTAVLSKSKKDNCARLLRVEKIGLDSQLNILFTTQFDELVFYPLKQ